MFKMVGICWRVQVYIVRQKWQKLGNSPITRPRNITDTDIYRGQSLGKFLVIRTDYQGDESGNP